MPVFEKKATLTEKKNEWNIFQRTKWSTAQELPNKKKITNITKEEKKNLPQRTTENLKNPSE